MKANNTMTTTDDNIFSNVNFDEGSDNPWGFDPGTYEVTVSDVSSERSKNQNLGLWVTFSGDEGKSIRRWVSMPEPSQDDVTRKRNTSYLRAFLNQLEIPKERWTKLEPDDFIGIDCTIIVRAQADNPEYMKVSKITRDHKGGSDMGIREFDSPTGPDNKSGLAF
jgi:hypothetical protein